VRVPYSRPIQIWVQSWRYSLTDGKGAPLDGRGTGVALRVDPNTLPDTFTVTITGEIAK
jgi:hypothetical protein